MIVCKNGDYIEINDEEISAVSSELSNEEKIEHLKQIKKGEE